MKKNIIIVAFFIFSILINAKTFVELDESQPIQHNNILGEPVLNTDASQLAKTVVTPHLEYPVTEGKNILWCATFQIAWNKLCHLHGEDIHLQNEPEMVKFLNKKTITSEDLDELTYFAWAGFPVKADTVATLEKELQQKFKGRANPELLYDLNKFDGNNIFSYCYLFVDLPFVHQLTRSPIPLQFGDNRVETFGIMRYQAHSSDQSAVKQILIYDVKNENDFILELKTSNRDHRLIIAVIKPAETLFQTIASVIERMRQSSSHQFDETRMLYIPVINFDIMKEYSELYNKPLLSKKSKILFWFYAKQKTCFRLDEKGATLKSEAVASLEGGLPDQLLVNDPFLVLLFYKNAVHPYFALWVDNAEVLCPYRGNSEYSIDDLINTVNIGITEPDPFVRFTSDMIKPEKIKAPQPVYPDVARTANITCNIIVEAKIDKQGNIVDATVLRSCPVFEDYFNQAALDVLPQWLFTPAMLHDDPIAVRYTFSIPFRPEK